MLFLFFTLIACKNLRDNLIVGQAKRIQRNQDTIYVHLIPHSHDDVGWLKTYEQYYYGLNNKVQWAGIQYTIDSVIRSLFFDKSKKFIQVEIAYFKMWWDEQDDEVRNKTKYLVRNGQLEFINGGWCMNDEATAYYEDIADQMTLGHQWILEHFQVIPTIGWQLDPFGHTSAQAELFALMGFDAWFFSRIDYQDMVKRKQEASMELISIVDQYSIFTHINYNHYEAPPGFSFDTIQFQSESIVDNPNSINYNVDKRAEVLVEYFRTQNQSYTGNVLMHTLGSDFAWSNAPMYFKNIDRLIKYINSHPFNMQIMYSTPSQYLQQINSMNYQYPTKTDDFLPYADRPNAYWTGYFTSRASLKLLIKQLGRFAQIERRFIATLMLNAKSQYVQVNKQQIHEAQLLFDEALATNQHHDAVTGTAKQYVTDDYINMLCTGFYKVSQQLYNIVKELIEFEIQDETPNIIFEQCNYNQTASQCKLVYEQLVNGNVVQINMIDNKNQIISDQVRIKIPQINVTIYDQNNNVIIGDVICLKENDCDLYFPYTRNPKQIIEYFRLFPNPENPSALILTEQPFDYQEFQDIQLNNSKPFKLTYQYYESSEEKQQNSGAYIFRPKNPDQEANQFGQIISHKLYIGQIVHLLYIQRDNVETQIKMFEQDTYEIETYIIEIPMDDKQGKEVVMNIATDIKSDDIFYTDSSGMRLQQRKLNYRQTWDLEIHQPIAGNYYPVNGIMQIQNNQTGEAVTLINDRSQGGTSLHSGELEVMLHRRMLKDDARGVGEPLNEKQHNGKGIDQRFIHQLSFFNKNENANRGRFFQYLQDLKPIIIFSSCKNEVFPQPVKSFKITYPRDLERIFTSNTLSKFYLQYLNNDTYLYRIHNMGEEGSMQLPELDTFQIIETTLTGNQLWSESIDKRLSIVCVQIQNGIISLILNIIQLCYHSSIEHLDQIKRVNDIYNIQMAFVYRSEQRGTYIPKSDIVGPGQYDAIQHESKPNHRPFNSTAQKNQKIMNQVFVPGPGAYDLQGSFECQKVIFQSDEQEIKILEVPKPISVFRSTTVRFKDARIDGPGPTQYFQDDRKKYHSAGHPNRVKKMPVLEQLVRDNKYISIPSIPSNIHCQGYTDNKDNKLELNPIDTTNEVGPGAYDLKGTFDNTRPKGVSWHKTQEKREQKSSLGPGCYEVMASQQPMYQMKPTTAFSSKQSRYSEFKFQQTKSNCGYVKKGLDNKQYSFHLSTNAGTTARETDNDSEYSYIEVRYTHNQDATPGPGYYDNTQQSISQFLNKSQVKGTLKTRTKRFHTKSQHTPGPGSYQLEPEIHRMKGQQPPFLAGRNRFEEVITETPAPGTYKPAHTMEQNLVTRLMKAPLGQFGVNEPRFKETRLHQIGPGTYDIFNQLAEKKGTASFLSHVPKVQESVNINPAPGAYNVVQHTIANKVIKPEEEDEKLAVIKPGFGVGSERWKVIQEEEESEIDYVDTSPKNPQCLFKKKKREPPPFMCREERFSKSVPKNSQPGPSEYADGMFPNWNKRTYNIIFAEI